MWASTYGQLGSARQLLKAGADKNCRGNNGETALHLAAAYGQHDLVKLLLSHGADCNATDEVLPVNYLYLLICLLTVTGSKFFFFFHRAGRKYSVDLWSGWRSSPRLLRAVDERRRCNSSQRSQRKRLSRGDYEKCGDGESCYWKLSYASNCHVTKVSLNLFVNIFVNNK